MSQIVAIVGRPNVGKSTLFNRLIGERKSIIDDTSGVTRDRIYGFSDWNGKNFTVVDTGGFVKGSTDIFEAEIRRQVQIAIEEANVIVFVVDVSTGITDLDEEIANMLRKNPKKVILAVNKVDNAVRQMSANEFWSLIYSWMTRPSTAPVECSLGPWYFRLLPFFPEFQGTDCLRGQFESGPPQNDRSSCMQ